MDLLLGIVQPIIVRRNEEDAVDRLNFQYTSYVYVFAALLIMSKQYMGSPIACWTPAEFRKGWIEYTTDFCLIENTYWVPLDDPALPSHAQREKAELPYYQWVQFVLVLLAFCFMLPHYLWRSLNWQSGVQVRSIVNACLETTGKPAKREDAIKKIAKHLNGAFSKLNSLEHRGKFNFIQRIAHGQTVTLYYILMKLLYIVNIVFQLIILHMFLGFNPIIGLWRGWNGDWRTTGLFPRSTMCDFEVRTKGNVQRYSVQCVLSLNMFNEKIFALLFVWLVILLVVTILSTLQWLRTVYVSSSRRNLAVQMLRSQGIDGARRAEMEDEDSIKKPLLPLSSRGDDDSTRKIEQNESNKFNNFVNFSPDKATVVKLISANAGEIVASHIVKELYSLSN